MGIRETINRHQGAVAVCMVASIVTGVWYAMWSQRDAVGMAEKAYYSDEAGKDFFADDINKVYPFDHDGKKAFRAYVYRGSDGKQFVSYIARYNDATRTRIEALLQNKDRSAVAGDLAAARGTGIEVKKPGGGQWVPLMSPQGGEIASHPTNPDRSIAQLVMP